MNAQKITVIGCGVSGLTTAITLLEAGYKVTIITEKLHADSTSAKAAAIWFPYEVRPFEKVNKWSRQAYEKFEQLCLDPASGVSMVPLTVLIKKEEDAWWKTALPAAAIRKATKEELPDGFPLGYFLQVPLIETQIYLDYLFDWFKKLNGILVQRKVAAIEDLLAANDALINCTGLEARELVGDQKLYAVQGQLVKIERKATVCNISAEFPLGEEHELGYVISRRDGILLGGTAKKYAESTISDEAVTQGIIDRCKRIAPQLFPVKKISSHVGLRPGRAEIRLEKEGKLLHNYGHGGAGFTVSWGCAQAILSLVKEGTTV